MNNQTIQDLSKEIASAVFVGPGYELVSVKEIRQVLPSGDFGGTWTEEALATRVATVISDFMAADEKSKALALATEAALDPLAYIGVER
jgi:hypothetical protein